MGKQSRDMETGKLSLVEELSLIRVWIQQGECCGELDSNGVCMAPACTFGDMLKTLEAVANRIEELEEQIDYYLDWVQG